MNQERVPFDKLIALRFISAVKSLANVRAWLASDIYVCRARPTFTWHQWGECP